MWTENWPGWFQKWGEPVPHRPATDTAFGVARWFARGGSFLSYYMAFGGTNFGRSVGGPQIVTSYDYDVQINEFILRNEPKYSHLQTLHQIIRSNEDIILGQAPPQPISVSSDCEVHVYSDSSESIVFLSNWNEHKDCIVDSKTSGLRGLRQSESIPPWSVTIMKGRSVKKQKTNFLQAQPIHLNFFTTQKHQSPLLSLITKSLVFRLVMLLSKLSP
jgi:hypothetical protein